MDPPTDLLLSVQLSQTLELGLGVWIIRMLAFGLTVLQRCSRTGRHPSCVRFGHKYNRIYVGTSSLLYEPQQGLEAC